MVPGKVTDFLSKIEDNSGEFPHVWCWYSLLIFRMTEISLKAYGFNEQR